MGSAQLVVPKAEEALGWTREQIYTKCNQLSGAGVRSDNLPAEPTVEQYMLLILLALPGFIDVKLTFMHATAKVPGMYELWRVLSPELLTANQRCFIQAWYQLKAEAAGTGSTSAA